MENAIIHLWRKPGSLPVIRSYQIFLDGRKIGTIRPGKHYSFEVRPGAHTLYVSFDWYESPRLILHLQADEEAEVTCEGPSLWDILKAGPTLMDINPKVYQVLPASESSPQSSLRTNPVHTSESLLQPPSQTNPFSWRWLLLGQVTSKEKPSVRQTKGIAPRETNKERTGKQKRNANPKAQPQLSPEQLQELLWRGLKEENKGRYEQAERLYRRVLTGQEKALGPNHQDIALTLHYLAKFYERQQKWVRAKPLLERAQAIWETIERQPYPEAAINLSDLASICENEGNYEQAEALYQRAVTFTEQIQGPEHVDTVEVLLSLALLYVRQQQYEKARPLYQRLLVLTERISAVQEPGFQQHLRVLREEIEQGRAGS